MSKKRFNKVTLLANTRLIRDWSQQKLIVASRLAKVVEHVADGLGKCSVFEVCAKAIGVLLGCRSLQYTIGTVLVVQYFGEICVLSAKSVVTPFLILHS